MKDQQLKQVVAITWVVVAVWATFMLAIAYKIVTL